MRKLNRRSHLEPLEERRVFAIDPVLIQADGDGQALTAGVTLNVAPRELVFTFTGVPGIDRTSLANGIVLTRAGHDGTLGNANDQVVQPGYLDIGDSATEVVMRFAAALPDDLYQVRFVGTALKLLADPPNDKFNGGADFSRQFRLNLGAQVQAVVPQPIVSGGRVFTADANTGLFTANGHQLRNGWQVTLSSTGTLPGGLSAGVSYYVVNATANTFQVALAPGGAAVGFNNAGTGVHTAALVGLQQLLDTVEVYFNANDPLDPASATNRQFYRLLSTNRSLEAGDDNEFLPTSVSYNATLGKAVLTFAAPLDQLGAGVSAQGNALRLRIGTAESQTFAQPTRWLTSDPGSSFVTARDLANALSVERYYTVGQAIEAERYLLNFPGGTNEPGHRNIDVDSHTAAVTPIGTPPTTPVQTVRGGSDGPARHLMTNADAISGVSTIKYNFRKELGFIPDGIGGRQPAFNSITENQKARSREALELIGRYSGVRFVETEAEGFIIATGDPRAVNPFSLTGPGGVTAVAGPTDLDGDGVIDLGGLDINGDFIPEMNGVDIDGDQLRETPAIVLDFGETWNDNPNGIYYITVMSQIMRLLGVGQTYDVAGLNAMGGDLSLLPQTAITSTSATTPIVVTSAAPHGLQTGDYVSITGVAQTAGAIGPNSNGFFRVTVVNGTSFRLDNTVGNIAGAGGTFTRAPESVFPGDADIVHLQHLYRPESKDIDLYKFTVDTAGELTAQIFAERMADASGLDSYLTLYQERAGVPTLVSRNDDYFSKDSLIRLNLEPGVYYVGVSSKGNDVYDPRIEGTGLGGTTQGSYQLSLDFRKAVSTAIIDATGVALDGDGDGVAGGVYNFWFRAAAPHVTNSSPDFASARTFYVDRTATAGGNGSLATPFNTIQAAVDAVNVRGATAGVGYVGDIIRIVGNNLNSNPDVADTDLGNNFAYQIGFNQLGSPLRDGQSLDVPRNTTVMIDRGAVFQMRRAQVSVGSTSPAPQQDRSGGALQVLGTPYQSVFFTSYNQQAADGATGVVGTVGRDENPVVTTPAKSDWGGLSFRRDLDQADGRFDWEQRGVFLDYVAGADIRFGGGTVVVDNTPIPISPIYLTSSRPTIQFNRIESNSEHAISANPNSFEESDFRGGRYSSAFSQPTSLDYRRIGPDFRGNTLLDNSTNAVFIRSRTLGGTIINEELTVSGRFDDKDVTYVIQENLLIRGTPGGALQHTVLTAPPTNLIIATPATFTGATGGFAAGSNLEYRMTYVDAFGNESLASSIFRPTAPLTAVRSQVTLTNLPTTGADFVARRLYRRVNGGGQFTLVGQIPSTATSYLDIGQGENFVLKVAAADSPATPNVAQAQVSQVLNGGGAFAVGSQLRYAAAFVDSFGRESPLALLPTALAVTEPGAAVSIDARVALEQSFIGVRYYRSLNGGQFDLLGQNSTGPIIDRGQVVAKAVVPATLNTTVTETLGAGVLQAGDRVVYRLTFINSRNGQESPSAAVLGEYTASQNNSGFLLQNLPTPLPNVPAGDLYDRLMIYRSVNGGAFEAIPDPLNLPLAPPRTIYLDAGAAAAFPTVLADAVLAPPATMRARPDGSLIVDPSVVVKLFGSRIEVGVGANLIAEGVAGKSPIFTSLHDDRYGAGGTFDAPNDNASASPTTPVAGNWGGIYFRADASGSFDHARLSYGGGAHRIEGTLTGLNTIEVHQADVRVANSLFERNADGAGGQSGVDRLGRGLIDSAQILVTGAQPVIVNNTVVDNTGAFISASLNSLNYQTVTDGGRQSGLIDGGNPIYRVAQTATNNGPLVRGNLIDRNTINGMLVRGGIATTEVVWDDTDIVHVLFDQVLVPDFHTFGGVRLESAARESLVVKSANRNGRPAGFVANGRPLEIEDRIGGTLQVLGQAGFPVVLTSFSDDTQSAGKTPDGRAQGDTNGDSTLPPLPSGPEITNGVVIDNDVPTAVRATTPGWWSYNVGPGGGSAAPQGVATAQGQTLLLANQQFLTEYLPYIDVGAGGAGGAVSLASTTITTPPLQIGNDLVRSAGEFVGAGGQNVAWVATTRMENGGNEVINSITFTAAGGAPLGDLRLYHYLDPNILAANDDILYMVGSPGQANFRAAVLDGAQKFGFALGGVYKPSPGELVNARYVGFTADSQANLQPALVSAAGLPTTQLGVTPTVTNVNPAALPQFNDPALGAVYGPGNAAAAMAWDVSAAANTATITTFLTFIGSGPPVVSGSAGEWTGLSIREYANDRNVETVSESEAGNSDGLQNAIPRKAQPLGGLAAGNKGGDETVRLGYTVNAALASPGDVDVYSFSAKAGTEVWIDIDRTSQALDTVLEVVDIDGNVLARSNDSTAEQAGAQTPFGLARTMPKNAPFAEADAQTTNARDAGMRIFLPGPANTTNTYFVRVRSGAVIYVTDTVSSAAVPAFRITEGGAALVQTVVDGAAGTNERQQVGLGATGLPFTLTFSGQTTALIAANATAAEVQSSLEALSNINPGDVLVTSPGGTLWDIEFTGGYRGVDVPQLLASNVVVTNQTPAVAAVNEVQRLTLSGAGSVVLRYDLEFTQPLALSGLTAAGVQAALESLDAFNPGDVLVTSPGANTFDVEFRGQYAGQDVAQLFTTYNVTVAEERKGGVLAAPNQNERQLLTVAGGTPFALTYNGQTTAPITGALTAAKIQLALEALSNIEAGDVLVTTVAASTIFRIEFRGLLANTDAPLIGAGSVTGATTVTQGGAGSRVQRVTVTTGALPGGTPFVLGYGSSSNVTSVLPANASAAEVQAALEPLAGVGVGNVAVSSPSAGVYDVSYVGALRGLPGLDLIGHLSGVNTIIAGSGSQNDLQQITPIDLLNFRLTFTSPLNSVVETTADIPSSATAAQVQAALEALAGVIPGDVLVTDTPFTGTPDQPRWNVEFTGRFRGLNVAQLVGSVQNSVQLVTISNPLPGESFALRFRHPVSGVAETTAPILTTATAADLQARLVALAGIGPGDVLVTAFGGSAWQVEFRGNLAATKVEPLVILRSSRAEVLFHDDIKPTGGTFTLRVNNETTAAIAFNASAATVQQALVALNNVGPGDVVVTAIQGGGYTIEFRGALGFGPVAVAADASGLIGGVTEGAYQMQVRLREQDEVGGTAVRYSRISNAITGIEVVGQPTHSPVTGEAAEKAETTNNTFVGAQFLGNLLNKDRGALGVAGASSLLPGGLVDVDWYSFDLGYTNIDGQTPVPVEVPNLSALTNVIFDLDYADGIARPNMAFYVFNAAGQLVLTSRDSNVADDRPNPTAGSGILDLSRGSVGVADPYIGNIALPTGVPQGSYFTQSLPPRYFVAVASDAQIPQVLTQFTTANVGTNIALVRLEPITSVKRIVEDHINEGIFANPLTWPDGTPPDRGTSDLPDVEQLFTGANAVPFHLGDVSLYASRDVTDLAFTVPVITQQNGAVGANVAPIVTVTQGSAVAPVTSEVQRLTITPFAALTQFYLSFAGASTQLLPANGTLTAAQLDAALEAVSTINRGMTGSNNVVVTGGPSVFNISFAGGGMTPAFRNQDVVSLVAVPVGAQNEVQVATIQGMPSSGSFTFTFRGAVSPRLPFNATAPEVQAALEATTSIGRGNVFVSPVLGGWRIEFRGALANQNLPALTTTASAVAGPIETTQIITVDGYTGARETVVGTAPFDIADIDFRTEPRRDQLLFGLSRDLEDVVPFTDAETGHLIEISPANAAAIDRGDDGIITYEYDFSVSPPAVVQANATGAVRVGYGVQFDAMSFADTDNNGTDDRLFAIGRRGERYLPFAVNSYIDRQRNILYQLNPNNGAALVDTNAARSNGAWTDALEIGEVLTQARLSVPQDGRATVAVAGGEGATWTQSDNPAATFNIAGGLANLRNISDGDAFEVIDSSVYQRFEVDAGFDITQTHNTTGAGIPSLPAARDGYFFILDPDGDTTDDNGTIYQIDTGPSLAVNFNGCAPTTLHGQSITLNLGGNLRTFVFNMGLMAPPLPMGPGVVALDFSAAAMGACITNGVVATVLQQQINNATMVVQAQGGANGVISLVPQPGQVASVVSTTAPSTVSVLGDTGVAPVLRVGPRTQYNNGDAFDLQVRDLVTNTNVSYRFVFDVTGAYTPPGAGDVEINLTGATTAAQVASEIARVVRGVTGVSGGTPFQADATASPVFPVALTNEAYVIVNGQQVVFDNIVPGPYTGAAIDDRMSTLNRVLIATESSYSTNQIASDIASTVNTAANSLFNAGAEGDVTGTAMPNPLPNPTLARINFPFDPSKPDRLQAQGLVYAGMFNMWSPDLTALPGATAGSTPVPFFAQDTDTAVAGRITDSINTTLGEAYGVFAFQEGAGVSLTRGTFARTNTPFTIQGDGPGGFITGMVEYASTPITASFVAVSSNGGLYDFTVSHFANSNGSTNAIITANYYITQSAADLSGLNFTALARAPETTENARYANTWIAVAADPTTGESRMYAIDYNPITGVYGGLQPVFFDGQTSVPLYDPNTGLPVTNVNGLHFSSLEQNLWQVTPYFDTAARQLDDGHGLTAVIDGSRPGNLGRSSLHFGTGSAGDYNFSGGAYGTMVSNEFSLEGYSPLDKPVLYFTNFVEADNSLTPGDVDFDTFRVFISGIRNDNLDTNGDGISDTNSGDWVLVGQDDANIPNQAAIAVDNWRQTKIDLSAFTGMSNLRIRLDFSTAGDMNTGDFDTVGEELRTVAGEFISDGQFVQIDGVRYELESGVTLNFSSGGAYRDGERVVINDGVNPAVTFEFDTNNSPATPGIRYVRVDDTMSASEVMFEFQNAVNLGGLLVNPLVLSTPGALVLTRVNGAGAIDEVQQVTSSTAANFTLTFLGQVTAPILRFDTAGNVQAALEALPNINIGDVAVTAGAIPGQWDVQFTGQYAGLDIIPLLASNGALVQTIQVGGAANEVQDVVARGGDFRLTFMGQTTRRIPALATAAELQSALEALPNVLSFVESGMVEGDVNVTELSPGQWRVEFRGQYRGVNLPLLTSSGEIRDVRMNLSVFGQVNEYDRTPIAYNEQDGSINLANQTGLTPGGPFSSAFIDPGAATIGDGVYGFTTGDFDVYRVTAGVGQLIEVTVLGAGGGQAGGTLGDSFVVIYDALGNEVAANDDGGGVYGLDSFVQYQAPVQGDYFVVVSGAVKSSDPDDDRLADPFVAATGRKTPTTLGSTGTYGLAIGVSTVPTTNLTSTLIAAPGQATPVMTQSGATGVTPNAIPVRYDLTMSRNQVATQLEQVLEREFYDQTLVTSRGDFFREGQQFTLRNVNNPLQTQVFEFDTGYLLPIPATGALVIEGDLPTGYRFSYTVNGVTRNFEFDSDGVVTTGYLPITYNALYSQLQLLQSVVGAINASGLGVTARATSTNQVQLDTTGVQLLPGNATTDFVANNVAFDIIRTAVAPSLNAPLPGVGATGAGVGRIIFTQSLGFSAFQTSQAIANAINGAGLTWVTAAVNPLKPSEVTLIAADPLAMTPLTLTSFVAPTQTSLQITNDPLTDTVKRSGDLLRLIQHTVDVGPTGPLRGPFGLETALTGDVPDFNGVAPEPDGFASNRRGQSNAGFEGVYVDDFIVGFAERGEMATGAPGGPTAANQLPVANSTFVANTALDPLSILLGAYQFEVRRGVGYEFVAPFSPGFTNDPNDRFAKQHTLVAPNGVNLLDGQTFTLYDGKNRLTFEFNDNRSVPAAGGSAVAPGSQRIDFNADDNDEVVARAIRDAINSLEVQARLTIQASIADGTPSGQTSTSNRVNLVGSASFVVEGLPGAEVNDTLAEAIPVPFNGSQFFINGAIGDNAAVEPGQDVDIYSISLAAGQRIRIDIDAQVNNSSLDSFLRVFDADGTVQFESNDNAAPGELSTLDSYLGFTAPTAGVYYIGVSGYNNRNYNPVDGTGAIVGSTGPYQLEISSALPSAIDALIFDDERGDTNLEREQGQLILLGNEIFNSSGFGISVDAGLLTAADGELAHPGAVRNTLELNSSNQAPGVVVANNVLYGNQQGGILFSGGGATITGATNANPIVITAANHGLVTGSTVTITDVLGNTNANGTFTVTRVSATQFSLNGVAGNGAYTGGGVATSSVTPIPYGRIVNNTLYGGGGALNPSNPRRTDTGIVVQNAAGPTLMNNIVANFTQGVFIADQTSRDNTVLAGTTFQGNGFSSQTFVADDVTNTMTATGHLLQNGWQVLLTSTSALPAGLVAGTGYFVVNATANTFQVSLTQGGPAINFTSAGTGVHTVSVLSAPNLGSNFNGGAGGDFVQVLSTSDPLFRNAAGSNFYPLTFKNNLSERQRVVAGTAPTFTLTFNGQTTAAISRTATAGAVQTALIGLTNLDPGDVLVTDVGPGDWRIEFGLLPTSRYRFVNVSQLTASNGATVTTENDGGVAGGSSRVIDSALDSILDRAAMVTVRNPLGLAPSPIITPDYDNSGQLRTDNRFVASDPGVGLNVFKDRGAIEDVDLDFGPNSTLETPKDNGDEDRDPSRTSVVLDGLQLLREFRIVLSDGEDPTAPIGSGIDDFTVLGSRVRVFSTDGVLDAQGNPVQTELVQGVDYVFSYDRTSNAILLTPTSNVWQSGLTYTVTLDPQIADNAGNLLIPNHLGDTTDPAFNPGGAGTPAGGYLHYYTIFYGSANDFGDLPDSFGTLEASNGASHSISTIYLGTVGPSAEPDGKPTPDASGDSFDDGVVFNLLQPSLQPLLSQITVTASAPSKLDAWFDLNQDGTFASFTVSGVTISEKLLDGYQLAAGQNVIRLTIPDESLRGPTFARFRVSADGVSSPLGLGGDGEVEDYRITLLGPKYQNPAPRFDVNDDGFVTGLDAVILVNYLNFAALNGLSFRVAELLENADPPPYLDVNGDGFLTGLDVTDVVAFIRANPLFGGGGEGESEDDLAPGGSSGPRPSGSEAAFLGEGEFAGDVAVASLLFADFRGAPATLYATSSVVIEERNPQQQAAAAADLIFAIELDAEPAASEAPAAQAEADTETMSSEFLDWSGGLLPEAPLAPWVEAWDEVLAEVAAEAAKGEPPVAG